MIYLFSGTDVEKIRSKAFEWVHKAQSKEPNLAYVRLAREEIRDAVLEEVSQSGGLFVKRLLVLIDDPFSSVRESDETEGEGLDASIVEERIDMLAASDNAVVILAPKLSMAKSKKIAAKAKVVYTFDAPMSQKEMRGFNGQLVNALASRSREKLWVELERAVRAGDAPEMLHGLLHWKARDLMEKGSRYWSPKEARQLSLALIELLQHSRRGGLDLALSLERFALSI